MALVNVRRNTHVKVTAATAVALFGHSVVVLLHGSSATSGYGNKFVVEVIFSNFGWHDIQSLGKVAGALRIP